MPLKHLGLCPYPAVYEAMQAFTESRKTDTPDEIWLCEHDPVFTLGWHGDPSHILDSHGIPVVACDRGGQATYHGPGQFLAYFLLDLKRKGQGVAALVARIEETVIQTLVHFGIEGHLRPHMPGVYVDNKKIAAIGLRVKNGRTYHGLALNVNMDLRPFGFIHPCGYKDLEVTDMKAWSACHNVEEVLAESLRWSFLKI